MRQAKILGDISDQSCPAAYSFKKMVISCYLYSSREDDANACHMQYFTMSCALGIAIGMDFANKSMETDASLHTKSLSLVEQKLGIVGADVKSSTWKIHRTRGWRATVYMISGFVPRYLRSATASILSYQGRL